MADKKKEEKEEPLTPEDLKIAKQKLKEFTKGTEGVIKAYGARGVISVMASIADKFSRGNDGSFKPGWFFSFLTGNILSGATSELLESVVVRKYQDTAMLVQNHLHEEYDSFSITERNARNNNIDKVRTDVDYLCNFTNAYWGSKGGLLANGISTGCLLGLTLVSGGVANLPIAAGVLASSAAASYVLNKKLNKTKIALKDEQREAGGELNKKNREMDSTSIEREINDPHKQQYQELKKKQNVFVDKFKKLVRALNKFSIAGTVVKTGIIGAVAALTWGNPTNMLVTTASAFGIYAAVNRCVASAFCLKEYLGSFAKAYRSFKAKVKDVTYGQEKIKSTANVIELDHIAFQHRDKEDITKRQVGELFHSDETYHIGPGITFLSGASGAGKSSLLDLLKHSDNLQKGAIRIGEFDKAGQFHGTDYKDIEFGGPCHHIAFDIQKGALSNVTVEEFITMANPGVAPEKLKEIKELLGIYDKTSPTEPGIDSKANIGTTSFSGGEISRLKLAQTLIKDSKIMILDEPTTGIDTTMKGKIIDYINNLKDSKTIVWVTHMPDEIDGLEAYQALDIDKPEKDKPATFKLWDVSKPEIKEEYKTFFSDRTSYFPSSRSSAEHQLPPSEEEIREAEEAVRKAQKKLDKLKQRQQSIPAPQNNHQEISNGKITGPDLPLPSKFLEI